MSLAPARARPEAEPVASSHGQPHDGLPGRAGCAQDQGPGAPGRPGPSLGQTTPLAPPGVLKVDLPGELEGADIEVVVQIRQGERTVAQGVLKRSAPSSGSISKLTLELRRSWRWPPS